MKTKYTHLKNNLFSRLSWRKFQIIYRLRLRLKPIPIYFVVGGGALLFIFSLFYLCNGVSIGKELSLSSPGKNTINSDKLVATQVTAPHKTYSELKRLEREDLKKLLGYREFKADELPRMTIPTDQNNKFEVELTIDPGLQKAVEDYFERHHLWMAAFVAIDPATGKVLSMVSHREKLNFGGNLCLRATFPAASIFKVITASAAVEEGLLNPDDLLPFTGPHYTLYLQDLRYRPYAHCQTMSMGYAFASSINSIFGKIGLYFVGKELLAAYANRFSFNQPIKFDMPVEMSRYRTPATSYELAEVSSGYTRSTTMSPLLGAMVASTVVNYGNMPTPYLVNKVYNQQGDVVYKARLEPEHVVVNSLTAQALQEMMAQTLEEGTLRRAFRRLHQRRDMNLLVGGKTGSLDGDNPPGRYEWMVGYAIAEDSTATPSRIAYSCMMIHNDVRRGKASEAVEEALLYLYGS